MSLGKLSQTSCQALVRNVFTTAKVRQQTAAIPDTLIAQCPMRKVLSGNNPFSAVVKPDNETLGRPFSEVPGPRGLPIIGTLLDYMKKDGLSFSKMFEAYRQRSLQYGPIFQEQITTVKTVVISDPDEYSKIIRAEGRMPIRREMEPMAYHRVKNNLHLGLVNAQGEEWYKYRTVYHRKMLLTKEIHQYSSAMNEVSRDFVNRLQHISEQDGEVKNIEMELFKWAMESIGTILFEERLGCLESQPTALSQDFINNLLGFFKLMQPLMYNAPTYKIYPTKLWRKFESYANNVISIGRMFIERKMETLQRQMDEGVKEGHAETSKFLTYLLTQKSLSLDEVTSSAVDLLSGAVETTSNAMLWTLYCLAKHPEIQDEIYNSIRKVVGDNGEITPQILGNLSHVKASLKEALRLYPITYATSRILQDDIEVCGYHLPAGTHVQANIFGMSRNEKLFPNPLEYRPSRWAGTNPDNRFKAIYNLVWGHGARMCIGRRIAEQEIFIALTKILQNFRMEYHEEDVEPVLNTVMTPDRPLRIKFLPRQH